MQITLKISDTPPTEFRLFRKGWNDTEHGRFLFDDEAAAAVMSDFEKRAVDLMIDLEHQALSGATSPDPTARDARGWFKLAVRNGDLYAVNVRWTRDGEARLSEKRQRYISPAFDIDPETKRVRKILNAAICAMPATHETPALVAASMKPETKEENMPIKKTAAAPTAETPSPDDPQAKLAAIAEALGVSANDPTAIAAAVDALLEQVMSAEEEEAPPADPIAASMFNRYRAERVTLAAQRQTLALERAAMESEERRKLCISMIHAGVRDPGELWADLESTQPKAYLLSIPIAQFREYVASAIKSSNPRASYMSAPLRPPQSERAADGGRLVSTPVGPVKLSARELRMCTELNLDPKDYAASKAAKGATQ